MGDRRGVKEQNVWIHWGLLLFWILIGAILRFTNLESKPPWADEWATLVFSLGNSFKTIPLEQIISLDNILLPVTRNHEIQNLDVVRNLMDESTHPPLYFLLTHWWLQLFPSQTELVSLWQARSLSALFGVISIPAMFGLGYLLRSSLLTGQIAAALMAVSPYGIYLAQETRHYTLAILWVIASLACLLITIKCLQTKTLPPAAVILLWIVVNSLAVATHYFFALSLLAQSVVLIGFWWREANSKRFKYYLAILGSYRWRRVAIAMLGTFVGCIGWILAWRTIPDDRLTEWVYQNDPLGGEFFAPIPRLFGWIVTMLLMLPIQSVPTTVIIISIVIILPILVWLAIATLQYFNRVKHTSDRVIIWYLLAAIGLIWGFTYIFDRDLTLAARFQFFYFPIVLLAIAAVFSELWRKVPQQSKFKTSRALVIFTLLIGGCGGISVVNNLAYQKPDRPDLVVPVILEAQKQYPTIPTVIATVHKTHEQTGEMMGLAWEWQKLRAKNLTESEEVTSLDALASTDILSAEPHRFYSRVSLTPPKFLLLHKEEDEDIPTRNLNRQIEQLSRPVDVWVVNFSASVKLETQNCFVDENFHRLRVSGYRYRLYHCS